MISAYRLSYVMLWLIATIMGSMGIFCLHYSFIVHVAADYALVFLTVATAILYGIGDRP